MKTAILICCVFAGARAVPSSWQAVQIDRHVKIPSKDIESSYKITVIKANDGTQGLNSTSTGLSTGNEGLDSFTNQFDEITNKLDEFFGTNKVDTPIANLEDNDVCANITKMKEKSQTEFIFNNPIDENCLKNVIRASSNRSNAIIVIGLDDLKNNVLYLDHLMGEKGLVLDKSYDLSTNLKEKYKYYRVYMPAQNLTAKLELSVQMADYNKAVDISKSLDEHNNGVCIKNAVKNLIEQGSNNLISYAYKLWENNCRYIVKKYFPKSVHMVLNHDEVLLVYKKDYGRMSLSTNFTQKDLDRDVFTHCTRENSSDLYWNFVPIWTNNRVSFKIWHPAYEKYLKVQQDTEEDGSRMLWGGTNDWYIEGRFKWNIVPVETPLAEDTMFCFLNIEYNQVLTSSVCTTEKTPVLAKSKSCSEDHAWYIADKNFVPV